MSYAHVSMFCGFTRSTILPPAVRGELVIFNCGTLWRAFHAILVILWTTTYTRQIKLGIKDLLCDF